jgi:hypothetical protein
VVHAQEELLEGALDILDAVPETRNAWLNVSVSVDFGLMRRILSCKESTTALDPVRK